MLTEQSKRIARAYYFDGLTGEQIAERLALPVGTVWINLHRTRKELRGQSDFETLLADKYLGGDTGAASVITWLACEEATQQVSREVSLLVAARCIAVARSVDYSRRAARKLSA